MGGAARLAELAARVGYRSDIAFSNPRDRTRRDL